MSATPPCNSSEWQSSNAYHLSDPSYEDVIDYQDVDGPGVNAAQRYQLLQQDYFVPGSTIPEYTVPYGHYNNSILPSEHLPSIGHDMEFAYPDRAYGISSDSTAEQCSQVYYPLEPTGFHTQTYLPEQYTAQEEHLYRPDLDSTPMDPRWIEFENNGPLYHTDSDLSTPSNSLSTYQSEAAARLVDSGTGPSVGLGSSQLEVNDLGQVDDFGIRIFTDTKGRKIKQRKCSICPKWFEAKPSNLQRHEDTHLGIKRVLL
ncbi:hypothetical protein RSOLAG22IIIB_08846 [Rhizoctonia solani]|uniref:Uncharacterized protein n=1 Tax=Rhizoctonia solani TaxID=456999 RepID=A0A0K6FUY5_9AGAM|nr:hypothetical protein RSOLAG22IIIB_08846 [Rhizoctonia solani]